MNLQRSEYYVYGWILVLLKLPIYDMEYSERQYLVLHHTIFTNVVLPKFEAAMVIPFAIASASDDVVLVGLTVVVPFVCRCCCCCFCCGLSNKAGSFLAAAEVRDCKTESGKSIPNRDASVAN